jgi:hypothetical protein
LENEPDCFDICDICWWEDDGVQRDNPSYRGGANHVSLAEAQRNFATIGVSDPKYVTQVRRPGPDDVRDPAWRPIKPT